MKELKFPEQQYCQELLSLSLTFNKSFSIKTAYIKSEQLLRLHAAFQTSTYLKRTVQKEYTDFYIHRVCMAQVNPGKKVNGKSLQKNGFPKFLMKMYCHLPFSTHM